MTATVPYLLTRERNLILGSLLVLAAGTWGVLIWRAGMMDEDMSLTMGMAAPLFLATWVAMMFPTAAPMILTFARVHAGKRQRAQPYVPTWVFVGAYLVA